MVYRSPQWTDQRIESLKSLWTEGLSASQIALALGGNVTRNACIGKLSRLGLTGPTSKSPRRTAVRTFVPTVKDVPLPEPAPEQAEPLLIDGENVTLYTINDKRCRWPIGDPSSADFIFCGHPPVTGRPYCPLHCRKAYQPQTPHRARDVVYKVKVEPVQP